MPVVLNVPGRIRPNTGNAILQYEDGSSDKDKSIEYSISEGISISGGYCSISILPDETTDNAITLNQYSHIDYFSSVSGTGYSNTWEIQIITE